MQRYTRTHVQVNRLPGWPGASSLLLVRALQGDETRNRLPGWSEASPLVRALQGDDREGTAIHRDWKWNQEARFCCARITSSSVVVPMISFARFNGTHKILPIESCDKRKALLLVLCRSWTVRFSTPCNLLWLSTVPIHLLFSYYCTYLLLTKLSTQDTKNCCGKSSGK